MATVDMTILECEPPQGLLLCPPAPQYRLVHSPYYLSENVY